MVDQLDNLVSTVHTHRCYSHPIFENWAKLRPAPTVLGALFHQIQCFCASTRPGWAFPDALRKLGLSDQSELLQEIVDSEEDHGPELATMAGYLINRASGQEVFSDLYDQDGIEAKLKDDSDELLHRLPGYDQDSGLTVQARKAISVFDGRRRTDLDDTLRNLGVTLALEIISHRHLIPGEKHCFVDAGLYGVSLHEPEMHYLLEHWGEAGAEAQHEGNAMEAVRDLIDDRTVAIIVEGINDFLDSLCALWDILDSALLQSGLSAEPGRQDPADSLAAA